MDISPMAGLNTRKDGVQLVIERAAEALEPFGDVRLSMDPLRDSGFDLLFSPKSGPHAGCVYLVEHKSTAMTHFLPSAEIAESRSKLEGLHHSFPNNDLHVVVSTNGQVGDAGIRLAQSAHVQVIPGISTGEELAAGVASLAGFTC
jgi:hypothetical protein